MYLLPVSMAPVAYEQFPMFSLVVVPFLESRSRLHRKKNEEEQGEKNAERARNRSCQYVGNVPKQTQFERSSSRIVASLSSGQALSLSAFFFFCYCKSLVPKLLHEQQCFHTPGTTSSTLLPGIFAAAVRPRRVLTFPSTSRTFCMTAHKA